MLDEHGVKSGHAVDAFAGTASVGRFLKRRGFRVTSCDIMTYSHVLQKAYVEVDSVPMFSGLDAVLDMNGAPVRAGGNGTAATHRLAAVLHYLEAVVPGRASLMSKEFAGRGASEDGKRMYFTVENALRIDAVREVVDDWRRSHLIDDAEQWVLLASLLEALDAVANTTGVYAAYVKSWQSNALRPLRLRVPELTTDTGLDCRALRGNINELAEGLGEIDLLYLDPPYNARQYSGYYHIPELVAMGWSSGAPQLRGKTGLIPDSDKRSDWSRRGSCVRALNNLLDHVNARYVAMSYNSEGIIPEEEIKRTLESRGARGSFRIHERDYARYRSDRDRTERRYKAARVLERIYFVEMKR